MSSMATARARPRPTSWRPCIRRITALSRPLCATPFFPSTFSLSATGPRASGRRTSRSHRSCARATTRATSQPCAGAIRARPLLLFANLMAQSTFGIFFSSRKSPFSRFRSTTAPSRRLPAIPRASTWRAAARTAMSHSSNWAIHSPTRSLAKSRHLARLASVKLLARKPSPLECARSMRAPAVPAARASLRLPLEKPKRRRRIQSKLPKTPFGRLSIPRVSSATIERLFEAFPCASFLLLLLLFLLLVCRCRRPPPRFRVCCDPVSLRSLSIFLTHTHVCECIFSWICRAPCPFCSASALVVSASKNPPPFLSTSLYLFCRL
eukprot:m.17759 g.17759  ORF g.17759 m.17759 type:complete len:323 (-) comp3612_c0_seq2:37-1005(-)